MSELVDPLELRKQAEEAAAHWRRVNDAAWVLMQDAERRMFARYVDDPLGAFKGDWSFMEGADFFEAEFFCLGRDSVSYGFYVTSPSERLGFTIEAEFWDDYESWKAKQLNEGGAIG